MKKKQKDLEERMSIIFDKLYAGIFNEEIEYFAEEPLEFSACGQRKRY